MLKPRDYQAAAYNAVRSEEHTSELQSRGHLVCRLLLEKKKTNEEQRGEKKSGRDTESGGNEHVRWCEHDNAATLTEIEVSTEKAPDWQEQTRPQTSAK